MKNNNKELIKFYLDKTIFNILNHCRKDLKKTKKDIVEKGIKNTIISYCFFIILIIIGMLIINKQYILQTIHINEFWPWVPMITILTAILIIAIIEIIILFIFFEKRNKKADMKSDSNIIIPRKSIAYWLFLSDLYKFNDKQRILISRKQQIQNGIAIVLLAFISFYICFVLYNIWIVNDYEAYNIIQRKLMGNVILYAIFFCVFNTY